MIKSIEKKSCLRDKLNISFGFGGGGGGGGGYSPTYYYHPEKAYAEAFKVWHAELIKVFDQYSLAMEKLASELSKNFKDENKKIEEVLINEFSKLKIKMLELEEMEEDNEEVKGKKEWLDEIVKEINEILEI